MATVELRPGDTLNLIWTSTQETPLGDQTIESCFAFTYEDLLSRLQAAGKGSKGKKSGTDGARFSRVVALASNAIKKGKWSTGAEIDRDAVFERMAKRFEILDKAEYPNITDNARQALAEISEKDKNLLKQDQQKIVQAILEAIKQ